eukprot:CFRG0374T1
MANPTSGTIEKSLSRGVNPPTPVGEEVITARTVLLKDEEDEMTVVNLDVTASASEEGDMHNNSPDRGLMGLKRGSFNSIDKQKHLSGVGSSTRVDTFHYNVTKSSLMNHGFANDLLVRKNLAKSPKVTQSGSRMCSSMDNLSSIRNVVQVKVHTTPSDTEVADISVSNQIMHEHGKSKNHICRKRFLFPTSSLESRSVRGGTQHTRSLSYGRAGVGSNCSINVLTPVLTRNHLNTSVAQRQSRSGSTSRLNELDLEGSPATYCPVNTSDLEKLNLAVDADLPRQMPTGVAFSGVRPVRKMHRKSLDFLNFGQVVLERRRSELNWLKPSEGGERQTHKANVTSSTKRSENTTLAKHVSSPVLLNGSTRFLDSQADDTFNNASLSPPEARQVSAEPHVASISYLTLQELNDMIESLTINFEQTNGMLVSELEHREFLLSQQGKLEDELNILLES